jgi:NitT/TauT family transport system substrate-binding protein
MYVLARALEQNGMSLADISVVPSDQLSLAQALHAGTVDAAVTYPPVALQLLTQPGAAKLFTTAQTPGEVVDVLAVDDAVISARARDIRNFLAALHRALDYLRVEPQQAYSVMAMHERIPVSDFEHAFTQEMVLVGKSDQEHYLAQGGLLSAVLRRCDAVLRASQGVRGNTRYETAISTRFLDGRAAL